MPQPRIIADAFGVLTVLLVAVFVVLGLLCIVYSVYFRSRIHRQGYVQLGYFNGPWIARIAFILVAIWWAGGEIARLTLLKGKPRIFTAPAWQRNTCRFYIISNIGFAEPSLFLVLVSLLHASVHKDSGALSRRWNGKTIAYAFLFCFPMFLTQFLLVILGPTITTEEVRSRDNKIRNYFTSISFLEGGDHVACTYPLLSTIILGLFDCVLISYISYLGFRMVSLVINKGLRKRIYVLIISVICFLPLRVGLLGFSVLPHPGTFGFEVLVFMAFLSILICAMVGVSILVYYPVADALALRNLRHVEMQEMPFDDYYDGTSSLLVNQSCLETGRNSDASTKRGSISFRTMIRDDTLPTAEGFEEATSITNFSNHASPSLSPPFRPLITLHGVPEN